MSRRKSARSGKARSSSKARSKAGRKGPPKGRAHSKQARVLGLLRSSSGATITGIMASTGWQSHSVRGFLTAVVRKKLGLKLASEKADGERVYRIIAGNNSAESAAAPRA
jgi:Protein of unknown function (DUF3489)